MPELPEVETTLRGIAPHLRDHHIERIIVREPRLRWPVSDELSSFNNVPIESLSRRAKYLLVKTTEPMDGHIIIHLGMSGSLRIVDTGTAVKKHDHIDFQLSTGMTLRYHDPRRFGAVLWSHTPVENHALLKSLGPEPLSELFTAEHLFRLSRKRTVAVKNFIMDSQIVVGVGNIYASEALFIAGVRPGRAAGRITQNEYKKIVNAIKIVLTRSIELGGTTLRDFVNSDGQPGYFQQTLNVYGRTGENCRKCTRPIKSRVLGQRSTFYCPNCQT